MKCEECRELLADFLLDELTEGEAVLVHEHLNLCPDCMTAYRELKGTGKALQAVPAFQPITATRHFGDQLKVAARQESQKIIRTLPPEKRLRMELRRANSDPEKAESGASQQRKISGWPGGVLAIFVVGLLAAGFILFFPKDSSDLLPRKVGTVGVVVGGLKSLQLRPNDHWTAVPQGKTLKTGDILATGHEDCARLELDGGGSLFLGPESELKVLQPGAEQSRWGLQLSKGELGLLRPLQGSRTPNRIQPGWNVSAPQASVRVEAGSEVFLTVRAGGSEAASAVRVLRGQASVTPGPGGQETLEGGTHVWYARDGTRHAEKDKPRPAPWRVSLCTEQELAGIFQGRLTIAGRSFEGLFLEFVYGQTGAGGLEDWTSNAGDRELAAERKGPLLVPADARFTHLAQLGAPLTLELSIHPDTPSDAALVLTAVETAHSAVTLELQNGEASLALRHQMFRRVSPALPFRANPKKPERITLELFCKGETTEALLAIAGGSKTAVQLQKVLGGPGQFWLSVSKGPLFVENLRLRGLVSREWLAERLQLKP